MRVCVWGGGCAGSWVVSVSWSENEYGEGSGYKVCVAYISIHQQRPKSRKN